MEGQQARRKVPCRPVVSVASPASSIAIFAVITVTAIGRPALPIPGAIGFQRVVEIGQRAIPESRAVAIRAQVQQIRWIEPRLAFLVKLFGRFRDGTIGAITGWLITGRVGQRESLEGGC